MQEKKIICPICPVCLCVVMRSNAHLGNPWGCIEKLKGELRDRNNYIGVLIEAIKDFKKFIYKDQKNEKT